MVVADIGGTEPYVGRGGWSWYTGAAGWSWRLATEYILGIRLVDDMTELSPCLPPDWPGYEATIRRESAGQRTQSLRAVVANVCLIAGTAGMILCVLLLSSALLPPLKVILALVVALVVVAWLQWRFLVRVYARAQIALKETFEANELGQAEVEAADLPAGLLEAAHLDSVRLAKGSPVIDQRIGELDLRANTGVSIVGIERDGERIVNPGPEETLLEGDRLLLLGEDTQLPKAKAELNG